MYRRLALFILLLPGTVLAHPVSFKDGFGIMPTYMAERQELELNYTYRHESAVAFNIINIEGDKDITFYLPQFNHKFYRRNSLDSQANIYGSLGLGLADQRNDTGPAGLAAIQADYETRRIYTLVYGEHLQAEGEGLNRIRYRAGFAPYLANFEELNTWLIAQVEYTPELRDEWTITPLIRLFYSNYLVEFGVSLEGDPFIAGIFHF